MCIIKGLSNRKRVTGYKIALKYKGEYYSPTTGIKYQVGEVPEAGLVREAWSMTKIVKFENRMFGKCDNILYRNEHVGRTQLFVDLQDAKDVLNDTVIYDDGLCFLRGKRFRCNKHLVLLKMRVGGSIYDASFRDRESWLVSRIISFEEI